MSEETTQGDVLQFPKTEDSVNPVEVGGPVSSEGMDGEAGPPGEELQFTPATEEEVKATEEAVQAPLPPGPAPAPVKLKNDAKIEWLNEDGTVKSTEYRKRSTAELLRFLAEVVGKDETVLRLPVRITVEPEDSEAKDKNGSPLVVMVGEGPLNEVATKIMQSTLHPNVVVHEYQRMAEFMAAHSAMKGLMLTLVFGDAQAAGFGYLSGVSTVTDADIITLGEAAGNQVQMFKDQIKEKNPGIQFPGDDKGKIIVPRRFRK